MNTDCPNCGKQDSLTLIREVEEFNIRGESIPVEVEYYRCEACGEEMMPLRMENDPLEQAYREYRRRKGMVQPEEIREFRQKFGLTQKEYSELLGIGVASLSRYENGALQEQSHDHILRFSMQPENLLRLIEEKPAVLADEKREELLEQLRQGRESTSLVNFFVEHYGSYKPGPYSGFQPFNLEKLIETIKFFCFKDRVYKTKLMKLLFYVDFKYYKEFTISITGCRYAHLPYGPVPDKHDLLISSLVAEIPSLTKDEVWVKDTSAELILSQTGPDLAVFEDSEVRVLATVKEYFKRFSAKDITEFSHKEKAYLETKNGQLISYAYAQELRI